MELKEFPPIGMSPNVWGPIFWTTMHIVTLGYSNNPSTEERKAVSDFFNSLALVIPCPVCKAHYAHFLKQSPVEDVAVSRKNLVFWLYNLHNKVNSQLGKTEYTWEQFIQFMANLRDKDNVTFENSYKTDTLQSLNFTIGGILLGITGFYIYNQWKK
jgi:hypothetical protein